MTRQVSRLAESITTRRGFLGNLGRGAAVVASGLGGFLAFPAQAEAKNDGGKKPKTVWLCTYDCENPDYGVWSVITEGPECPSHWGMPCFGSLIEQKKYKDPKPW
jgi:hypothetical protein